MRIPLKVSSWLIVLRSSQLMLSVDGRRLRAAGVPLETRKVLLGHKNGDITSHYSAAEVDELLDAANRICREKSGNDFAEKKNRLTG